MSNRTSSFLTLVFASTFLISIGFLTHDAHADQVIATIPLGTYPTGIGVNLNTNMIYVAANGATTSVGPVIVIDGNTNTIKTKITVGPDTEELGVNPNTNMIYVAQANTNKVTVIDGATNSVVGTIPVGKFPTGVGVNPNTNMIYVSNYDSNTVTVINGTTSSAVSTIPVGWAPAGVGINPNTNKIYVVNRGADGTVSTVSVIDGSTNSVVSTIPVAKGSYGIGVNPNTNMIYVGNLGYWSSPGQWTDGNTVSVINGTTNNVIITILVGISPVDIGINPATNKIYVANSGDCCPALHGTVSIIDGTTNSVVDTIPDGGVPTAVAVNPATTKIYVANDNQTVSVIDGSASETVPSAPRNLAALADNSQIRLVWDAPYEPGGTSIINYNVYRGTSSGSETLLAQTGNVTNYNDTAVTNSQTYFYRVTAVNSFGESPASFEASDKLAPDRVVATIPLGISSTAIGVNPNTNMIYVAVNRSPDGQVMAIDGNTNTAVAMITGVPNTAGVGVNPNTNMIYLAHDNTNNVSVIDGATNSVVSTITVGNGPHGVGVNPNTNKIYVGNLGYSSYTTGWVYSNTTSVIDGATNSVVSTITVGSGPHGIGVNPNTNKIYVGNSEYSSSSGHTVYSNTVSVIDGATNSVVSTITVGNGPHGVGVNPNTNKIYVANIRDNTTSVIDGATNSVVSTIPVGIWPEGIGVNPNTNKIYVANWGSNTVSVIDGRTNSVVSTITVGNHPADIGVNPNTSRIYVLNDETVSVIDGSSSQTATSILAVNSQDSYGNTLTGYFTKLYASNGTQLDAGYTPYNFTLDNGQNYSVRVENHGNYKFNHWADTRSTNASRLISISSDESITAVYATISTHPSDLTATAVSSSEIDLGWNVPSSNGGSPVTGYRIQQSNDDSTWTTIAKNTNSTSTTYSDTGLNPDTTYYYRVFALNSVGSSYASNVASATTPILSAGGINVGGPNSTSGGSSTTGNITLNNIQSTSGTTSSSNQITLSNFDAGSGSNHLLLVGISANNNNAISVTFNGTPLSQAVSSFYNNDAEFWYLTNPSGTGDIIVTTGGPTQAVVGAYSLSGVNQTAPIPTHVAKHNTAPNSPNISITTKYANDWVLDLPSIYGGSTLNSPTCTQQWDANVPNAITGASSSTTVPSPATIECKWAASSADFWDDVAVEVKAN